MARFRKSSSSSVKFFDGKHRFEHWYRDITVYFITARCRDKYPAFESEHAKEIFWDRFDHCTKLHGFVPWVTSLLNNHYHTLGYLKVGEELGPMMRKLHGSVAKLVNDILPDRRVPFWRTSGDRDYFDGCIRDEVQCRRAYRYTLLQSVRSRICKRWEDYPHTHVRIELACGLRRATERRRSSKGKNARSGIAAVSTNSRSCIRARRSDGSASGSMSPAYATRRARTSPQRCSRYGFIPGKGFSVIEGIIPNHSTGTESVPVQSIGSKGCRLFFLRRRPGAALARGIARSRRSIGP